MLKSYLENIKSEIDAVMERDPAARSRLEVALLYSGFTLSPHQKTI